MWNKSKQELLPREELIAKIIPSKRAWKICEKQHIHEKNQGYLEEQEGEEGC